LKKISILGSTGSIGKNALEVVRAHRGHFKIQALAARRNVRDLAAQALEFRPELVCIYDEALLPELRAKLSGRKIRIVAGEEGLEEASTLQSVDLFLFALVGAIGLKPIFAAVKKGKNVAIANKEPLVMAGRQLIKEAARSGSRIIPVDSEHSGMWQCLEGKKANAVNRLSQQADPDFVGRTLS
jgi:1-deoxy-D-xylulose-5-phosphate reductoisomerase